MRSRWAVATLGVAGALGAVAFLHDLTGFGILDAAAAGTLTDADADAFDSLFATIGQAQLVAYVTCAVAFLAWLSRSVDNVERLAGGKPAFTPRMSIAWWFIPFANFVMPYQVVADLYRRMAPVERISTLIVLGWWVFFLGGNIMSNIAGRVWIGGNDLASLQTGLQLYAISDLADPIAAILAIRIVLSIQRWADARAAEPATPTDAAIPEEKQFVTVA